METEAHDPLITHVEKYFRIPIRKNLAYIVMELVFSGSIYSLAR